MESSRYKTVNTFSRPVNVNQCIACFVVVALFVVFFTAVQNNIADSSSRITLIVLFSLAFVLLVVAALASCQIDPVDEIIPIYLSSDRANLSSCIQKCLFCQSCQSYVLETSRHCKICERCVDDFDHHCVWINNCIGKKNYSWFFVMILCTVLYLTFFITTVAVLWTEGRWQQFLGSMIVDWIFLILAVVVVIPVAILLALHCFLSCRGITTYEFIMSKRLKEVNLKAESQNQANITQNAPFSRNNKVGVEMDEIIFHPQADLQTLEHKQISQNSEEHQKKSDTDHGHEEKPQKQVYSNSFFRKKGTLPVEPQLELKQFYKNHKSLKLLIGSSIEVDHKLPVRRHVSWKRDTTITNIIEIAPTFTSNS